MSLDNELNSPAPDPMASPETVGDALPQVLAQAELLPSHPTWARRIQGRGGLLLSIIALGVVLGALIGVLTTRPIYRAVGVIQVSPGGAGLDGADEPTLQTPAFDALIERQMTRLGSKDVIQAALRTDAWHELGRPIDDAAAQRLRESMEVSRTRSQVRLSVNDRDPRAAVGGVRALLEGYTRVVSTAQAASGMTESAAAIEEKRAALAETLDKASSELAAAKRGEGPVSLESLYASKLTELNTLTVLTREAETDANGGNGRGVMMSRDETLARMARSDNVLAGLLIRREAIRQQLAGLLQRMGDNAPAVISLRREQTWVETEIDHRLDAPRAKAAQAGNNGNGQRDAAQPPADRLQRLKALQEQAKTDVKTISERLANLRAIESRVAALQQQVDAATAQLAQLASAEQAGERVSVVDRADSGVLVYQNPRPRRAAIGGVIGLFVGLLAAGLFAGTDRRLHNPANATRNDLGLPLLGAVPIIDPAATDPRSLDLTALSIHEIRVMLQARAKTDNARTFAVTSPSAGSGKTSLTVGLASSLALSGTRTLLVDCELASRVLNPHAPGNGSKSAGGDTAPAVGRQSLDQVMLDMGYLSRTDAEIFLYPADAKVGLLGMLDGKPLRHCAVETNITGLSILPALSAEATHIGRMSGQFIRRLIEEARDEYDMVLFDTGPIPGSVEALFVAGEADGVILVASRGEMQSRFDRSLAYLRLVGAKLIGTVFNRAAEGDLTLQTVATTAEQRAASLASGETVRRLPANSRNMGSGILAAAVQFQAKTPPAATENMPGSTDPASHSPRPMGAPADDISLKDTGDITNILMDDDKPASPEHGHLDTVITAEIDKLKKPGMKAKN
ncbi:MAG: AAA family ATPase [Planctomycetes bacterium]|nr:AAA family ATPase [Planctomycetota bacterium]